jgi:hypothetical protein
MVVCVVVTAKHNQSYHRLIPATLESRNAWTVQVESSGGWIWSEMVQSSVVTLVSRMSLFNSEALFAQTMV